METDAGEGGAAVHLDTVSGKQGGRSEEGPFSITLTCTVSLLTPVSFQEGRLRRGNACLVFMLGSLLLWSHLLEMEPPPGHWSRGDGEILRVLIWG